MEIMYFLFDVCDQKTNSIATSSLVYTSNIDRRGRLILFDCHHHIQGSSSSRRKRIIYKNGLVSQENTFIQDEGYQRKNKERYIKVYNSYPPLFWLPRYQQPCKTMLLSQYKIRHKQNIHLHPSYWGCFCDAFLFLCELFDAARWDNIDRIVYVVCYENRWDTTTENIKSNIM